VRFCRDIRTGGSRGAFALLACLMLTLPGISIAQTREPFRPDRMDTVLYGVAYYPEYMPYDRLDQDVPDA